MSDLKELCKEILWLYDAVDRQEMLLKQANDHIDRLLDENNKLMYGYEDSKLNRDKPLPYKWRKRGEIMFELCPKCENIISNWQTYCHFCGQKIEQHTNPLPEMEVKMDEVEE